MPTVASIKLGRGNGNDIVARAIVFVGAAGTSLRIRTALQTKGYTNRVHAQIWAHIHEVCQFTEDADSSEAVRVATNEISDTLPSLVRISRATLKNDYPEQHDFVFEGLEVGVGTASLVGMKLFLDRVDLLESSKDRKATRKVDAEAIAKLAERGTTSEERERLRGLLAVALSGLDDASTVVKPGTGEAIKRLRGLVEEWTEIARVVIERRADLIQLGVLRRRKSKKQDQQDDVIVAPPMLVSAAPTPASTPTAMPASAPRGLLAPSVPPPPPVPTISAPL